eukprot:746006-Hanusia_phi.AAC.1
MCPSAGIIESPSEAEGFLRLAVKNWHSQLMIHNSRPMLGPGMPARSYVSERKLRQPSAGSYQQAEPQGQSLP